MLNLNQLFKNKKAEHEIGDRVSHRESMRYGTVTGASTFKTVTKVTVPVINVKFDDGLAAVMIPANEFINLTRSNVKA